MKNTKKKKIILNTTLDELFNVTTNISLRWIYRSAKNCLKNNHLDI